MDGGGLGRARGTLEPSSARLFKAEHILTGGLGWVRKEPVESSLPSGIKGRTQNASERQQISSHLQQLRA